jgi:hypothetical protein
MDIMMPPLHEQPAPAPWLARRAKIDVPSAIREILERRRDAGLAEIVGELRSRQIDVDGIAVATWIERFASLGASTYKESSDEEDASVSKNTDEGGQ